MVAWRMVVESLSFALFSLKKDRLRTLLSLSGITVGIFSLLAAGGAAASLRQNIMSGMDGLSAEMFFITKYPFAPEDGEDEQPLWRYDSRPEITFRDFNSLRRNSALSEPVLVSFGVAQVSHRDKRVDNVRIVRSTEGIEKVSGTTITSGAPARGREVMIGSLLAQRLFASGENPVGKRIYIGADRYPISGVLSSKSEAILNPIRCENGIVVPWDAEPDNLVVPFSDGMIALLPGKGVCADEAIESSVRVLRASRALPAERDNDFSVNKMDYLLETLDDLLSQVGMISMIISSFSLLIGIFGTANIMFVTVNECRFEIGMLRAMGATGADIAFRVICQSAMLSFIGALGGIIIYFILTLAVNTLTDDFVFTLPLWRSVGSVLLSLLCGVISGLIPAIKAAKENPVDAIVFG